MTYLDIYQIIHTGSPELGKLSSTFAQERGDIIPLGHLDRLAMPAPVPETIRDFNRLGLDPVLFGQPLFPQDLASYTFRLFAVSVGQERGVYVWVFGEFAFWPRVCPRSLSVFVFSLAPDRRDKRG